MRTRGLFERLHKLQKFRRATIDPSRETAGDGHSERLSAARSEAVVGNGYGGRVLVLEGCSDTGSTYGLVIEYGGNGAKVEGFRSDGATRRALQMVGNNADVGIEIRNFAGEGRPVLLGITERLEFVDASSHAADLTRYRARGYAMTGNRIAIAIDRPMEVVDVHGPSVNAVNMAGVTAEYYPPRPLPGP